jgi:hypothetical protein
MPETNLFFFFILTHIKQQKHNLKWCMHKHYKNNKIVKNKKRNSIKIKISVIYLGNVIN